MKPGLKLCANKPGPTSAVRLYILSPEVWAPIHWSIAFGSLNAFAVHGCKVLLEAWLKEWGPCSAQPYMCTSKLLLGKRKGFRDFGDLCFLLIVALHLPMLSKVIFCTGKAGILALGPAQYAMHIPTAGQWIQKQPDAELTTNTLLRQQDINLAGPTVVMEGASANETFPAMLKISAGLLALDNTRVRL